jgi:S-adenosylmethionine uptake transporter
MIMNNNKYLTGISWFILSLIVSVINDSISKYAGLRLPSIEITFFRFLFGTIILAPLILYYGMSSIRPKNFPVQIARGAILFAGMSSWAYGLTIAPIALATVISFTIPLFVLVLASFFLQENITWKKWIATIFGFLGIVVIIEPQNNFDINLFWFLFAAALFASLDIVNKKFVLQETMLTMLFYSAIVTTILTIIPTIYVWETPTIQELFMLFFLGIGANFILFCLLKSFSSVDASDVAPYRYLELLFSLIIGAIFFEEFPNANVWFGAVIIIPSTLFIAWSSSR